jgi:hypothetical protein
LKEAARAQGRGLVPRARSNWERIESRSLPHHLDELERPAATGKELKAAVSRVVTQRLHGRLLAATGKELKDDYKVLKQVYSKVAQAATGKELKVTSPLLRTLYSPTTAATGKELKDFPGFSNTTLSSQLHSAATGKELKEA